MVTSIAIPSATLNINTVDGFRGTPTQPMTPAVINKGIILGINEQINILKGVGLKIEWHEFVKAHTIAGEMELEVIRNFIRAGFNLTEKAGQQ